MVHAENGDIVALGQEMIFAQGIHGPEGHALSRPDILETEATGRAIRISETVGTPLYVVQVQSKGAAEEIAAGNARGARVIGEVTCPQLLNCNPTSHLLFVQPILPGLDESRLWDKNWTKAAVFVMSPSIRKQAVDGVALRHALASGLLHLVGTDHAVFNSTQTAAGCDDFRKIPNGVNGIEERMHVTWELMVNSGLMSPSDFVRVTSTGVCRRQDIQHLPSQRNNICRLRRRRYPTRSQRPMHAVCCYAPFQDRHERF
jgi:dihydropyrimidinase